MGCHSDLFATLQRILTPTSSAMLSIKLFVALASCLALSEATFIIGTTAVGGAWALAGLLAVKAAVFGGVALGAGLARSRSRYGSRRSYRKSYRRYGRSVGSRYGRSVDDEVDEKTELLLTASLNDGQDCAKKLVCSLNAEDVNTLPYEEQAIAKLFGQTENIDVTAVTVEFDLAAHMGRKAGQDQCQLIYSRCPYGTKALMDVIRQPNAYLNQL